MSGPAKQHWERVYTEKSPVQVSWYQPVPQRSLTLIDAAVGSIAGAEGGRPRAIRLLDVGGGASNLVDHLLQRAGLEVCVLDIAGAALAAARARLGELASRVRWIEADVTGALPEIADGSVDIWHDRAVFHFLTTPEDRDCYARNLARVVRPGGVAIIATFAPDGPAKCSGLEVARHTGDSIRRAISGADVAWMLNSEEPEEHTTPWGAIQRFTYAVLTRA